MPITDKLLKVSSMNKVPVDKLLATFNDIEQARKDGTYVVKCPACGSIMDVHPNADCFARCTNEECGMIIRA